MNTPQYADVSAFQGAISWPAYKQWAASFDGTARVAMKATEGTGFTDPRFAANRAGALAAGVGSIIYYHYGRPDLTSATAEANWMFHVVGNIREQDAYMLDYEQNTPQATAQWAYDFLSRLESLTGRLPIIYASTSFIQAHLQDARLAKYPLVLASWTYDVNKPPACPKPWTHYTYWQWSDKATIPGISGPVDANVFLGGTTTSTYELAGFPMISQRDGDANQDADCVPASIAACMQWLTGQHYTAREIKDAVYGAGYVGGTAATAYVDYCAAHGVTLAPINGTGSALVTAIRGALAEQRPCLITEPDPYAAGWTHVCAAYKCDASTITVMDPWIDAPVTKSDAQWASQLEFNQIWTLQRSNMIPTNWKDDGTTLTAPNGVPVKTGFRDWILNHAWDPADVPLAPEAAANPVEMGFQQSSGPQSGTRQVFMYTELCWTSARGVYKASVGREFATALQKLASVPTPPAPTPAPVDTTALVAAINAIPDSIAPAVAQALVEAKKL